MAMKRLFGNQFPVTMERKDGRLIYLVNEAFYDEHAREARIDDDYAGKFMAVDTVVLDSDNEFRFLDDSGDKVVLRPTRPDDAAASPMFSLGIPLPVEIIGAFMTGTISEPSISAAVDDEGDVHTMILETGTGLYARYSRQWILLSDISPIESLDIVDVPGSDLEHYDMADDVGKVISIRDLSPINPPAASATGPSRAEPPPAVTASASAMIVVASAADIPEAIAWAEGHPESRWYVARKAQALGWAAPMPWADQ